MGSWTKEAALAEIESLIDDIDSLKRETRYSANHTRWIFRVLSLLEGVFGANSRFYISFEELPWRVTGQLIVGGPTDPEGSWNPQGALERKHHQAYLHDLESAKGLLLAASDSLSRSDIDSVYCGKNTAHESSMIIKILNIAERKLRKVIRDKPDREIEVQNALESLLIGAEIPFSRETGSIEYSSKTYKPDFTVEKISLAIEVKLCSKTAREKELIAEINDDIAAYKTKYDNILFIIYDLGFIRDVDRFVYHFEKNENVSVKIVKH